MTPTPARKPAHVRQSSLTLKLVASQVRAKRRQAWLYCTSLFTLYGLIVGTAKLWRTEMNGWLAHPDPLTSQQPLDIPTVPLLERRTLWQHAPIPDGMLQQALELTEDEVSTFNITGVHAAVRGATIEPLDDLSYASYAQPGQTVLHVRYHSWDLPLAFAWKALSVTSKVASDPRMTYKVTLVRSGQPTSMHTTLCTHSFDLRCDLPAEFARTDVEGDIELDLSVAFNDRVIGRFDLTLSQQQLYAAPFAICNKPLYTLPSDTYLLQWREHHRLLGIDVVHWSARNRSLSEKIDRLNQLTGGHDTFDYMPMYDVSESGLEIKPYYDEARCIDQCYIKYRHLSDLIGIWDTDEWLALSPATNWTRAGMDEWRQTQLDKDVGSVQIPMKWVDRIRFPAHSAAALLDAVADLSDPEINAIQALSMAGDRYFQSPWPDGNLWYKSVYNTRNVRHVHIHYQLDQVEGTPTILDDYDISLFHTRDVQWKWHSDWYYPWPIVKGVVLHWRRLIKLVEALLPEMDLSQPVTTVPRHAAVMNRARPLGEDG